MFENRPLIEYFPNVLRGVREFQALTVGEEPELASLWGSIKDALNDQFILSLTEYGVKRWEKILKIIPKATFTLDERRFMILTRLAVQLPYTIRMLHRMLSELCGPDNFSIQLDAGRYTLRIQLAWLADNNADAVGLVLKRICPANLFCVVAHDTFITATIYCLGATLHSKTYTLKGEANTAETIEINKTDLVSSFQFPA